MGVVFQFHFSTSMRQLTTFAGGKNCSMSIRAVYDDRMLYTDIDVGWLGSVSDARVWKNSPLYESACADMLRPSEERIY